MLPQQILLGLTACTSRCITFSTCPLVINPACHAPFRIPVEIPSTTIGRAGADYPIARNFHRSVMTKMMVSSSDTNESGEMSEGLYFAYAIDSFLQGEYDLQLSENTALPSPDLSPSATVELALRSLRDLDNPEPDYGAAVFMQFCTPLSRAERWGDSSTVGRNPWKEIMRGSLSPSMLARRIRSSEFPLLRWEKIDVTEGAFSQDRDLVGIPTVAYVSAALHVDKGIGSTIIQFTLKRRAGIWLIDGAFRIQTENMMPEETILED